MFRIEKFKRRYWAVWCGDELVAVVVYKKGAKSIVEWITGAKHGPA